MLKKTEDRTIMTGNEAAEKYNDCCFLFVITEQIGYDSRNSKGYVAYTYHNLSEPLLIPKEEKTQGVALAYVHGLNYDPYSDPNDNVIYYDTF